MPTTFASESPRRLLVVLVSLATAGAMACSDVVADNSPCRNLVYKDGGVPRKEYLPCAGEMMTALEELDRQTEAALGGDRQARADGQANVRRVIALMKAAGGMRLLERLDDRPLSDMNLDIHNAVTHYQAFYMVRILDEPNQFAAKSREAARSEFVNGRRNYEDARRSYRLLR